MDQIDTSVERTLVVQALPGIGDTLWFLPHLKAIARNAPDKKISLLTIKRSHADYLLGHEPFIDDFFWLPSKECSYYTHIKRLQDIIKGKGFNHVWVLHHSPRYSLASKVSGVKNVYSYGFGWQKLFQKRKKAIQYTLKNSHHIQRATELLRVNNVIVDPADWLIQPNPESKEIVLRDFASYPRPWLALGVGTTAPIRCWPEENFAVLAQQLAPTGTVFICGAPSEKEQVDRVVQITGKKNVIPVTDRPLAQTIALLNECDGFIGNDSGLMNLSGCLSRPTIGIYRNQLVLTYTPSLISVTPLPEEEQVIAAVKPERVLEVVQKHFPKILYEV